MKGLFKKKPKCPYCSEILDPAPKRKKKCPHCGEYIFVRRGQLRTQDQADIEDWLARVEHLGITRRMFDEEYKARVRQHGFNPPVNDVKWSILNELVLNELATSAPSHHDLKMIYFEMAIIAREEGKNPTPYLTEMAKQDLLRFRRSGLCTRVEVNTSNDDLVCPACRQLERKTFTIDDALATLPVPNGCQNEGGCRCWYSPVMD